MSTPIPGYHDYLASPGWALLRTLALERDRHRCAACMSTGRLHVHHLTYERFGHEELGDLLTLCEPCHALVHRAFALSSLELDVVTRETVTWISKHKPRRKPDSQPTEPPSKPVRKPWKNSNETWPSWVRLVPRSVLDKTRRR